MKYLPTLLHSKQLPSIIYMVYFSYMQRCNMIYIFLPQASFSWLPFDYKCYSLDVLSTSFSSPRLSTILISFCFNCVTLLHSALVPSRRFSTLRQHQVTNVSIFFIISFQHCPIFCFVQCYYTPYTVVLINVFLFLCLS